ADLFADGHDKLAAVLRYRRQPRADEPDTPWLELPMRPFVNDRWQAAFTVDEVGHYEYTVEAWVDRFATWRHQVVARGAAGEVVGAESIECAGLVRAGASALPSGTDNKRLLACAGDISSSDPIDTRVARALSPELTVRMAAAPEREYTSRYPRTLRVTV